MMETQEMMSQLICIMAQRGDRASSSLFLHHHILSLSWHLYNVIILQRGWRCWAILVNKMISVQALLSVCLQKVAFCKVCVYFCQYVATDGFGLTCYSLMRCDSIVSTASCMLRFISQCRGRLYLLCCHFRPGGPGAHWASHCLWIL